MNAEIELRHLRSFTAVAEELHFGRAARRLHIAQPALSQQIRRLEDLLGYDLFQRTSRSVALTAAGVVLHQKLRRDLEWLQLDFAAAASVARGEIGRLNVGFIGSGMLTALPRVLERYAKGYPRVDLQLHESFTSRVTSGLAEGRLDAGLVRDSDPLPSVVCEPLFSEPFVAVLPCRHRLAGRARIRGRELRDEPFVFYTRGAGTLAYDKPLNICAAEGIRPRVVQEASHWLTIVRLIQAGLGVSIAPACVRTIAASHVTCVPLTGTNERSTVELAYRCGEERPIVLQFNALARTLGATHRTRRATA